MSDNAQRTPPGSSGFWRRCRELPQATGEAVTQTFDEVEVLGRLRMQALKDHGWNRYSINAEGEEAIAAEIGAVASALGSIAPGRGRKPIERIVAEDATRAYAGSMSSKFGMMPLPLHTDTAHWSTPCRYLVLACVATGPKPTATCLLDGKSIAMSDDEHFAARSEVFSINNGRRSFYGTVMERGRPYIRLDPACMQPVSARGAGVLEIFTTTRQPERLHSIYWSPGDILVLDNWRMLHGRGVEGPTQRGRVLLRAMVR